MATIETDQFLPHPPARVWRALTDRHLLSQWLMPTDDFAPAEGTTFALDAGEWGTTHCEVLEIVDEQRLKITWQNPPLDTTVTWQLEPEGHGTRLFVEHAGFDLDDPMQRMAYDGMSGGWAGEVAEALETCLDEHAAT
jgi:uncharacterized protein YndB with AHSA1/START domain